MMTNSDLKNFLRDLLYLEEEAYTLATALDPASPHKQRIIDTIHKKQMIVAHIVTLIS